MQLRLEFQTIKKGRESMMEYIYKLKTISDNLTVVGESVKETDQILQLLGGLGSKYNDIIASLTTKDEELSLHSVHNMLITYEERLNSQNTSSSDLNSIATHTAVQTRPHNSYGFSHAKRGNRSPIHSSQYLPRLSNNQPRSATYS